MKCTMYYSWTNQWHYDKLVRYSRICPVKLPLFMEEIYSGFWAFEALRREVIKICGRVIRRYQISNKWTKKVVPDCKGKLNISDVKCMRILVIILLIKVVGVQDWWSCIAMDILHREVLKVFRLIKWNML